MKMFKKNEMWKIFYGLFIIISLQHLSLVRFLVVSQNTLMPISFLPISVQFFLVVGHAFGWFGTY